MIHVKWNVEVIAVGGLVWFLVKQGANLTNNLAKRKISIENSQNNHLFEYVYKIHNFLQRTLVPSIFKYFG